MAMKLGDIPVVMIGPGSQPQEEDGAQLEYISMPSDMATYAAPRTPEPEEVENLLGAREAMRWLQKTLDEFGDGSAPELANISGLDAANRDLVNQILGEGEVSAQYNGDFRARIQESVLAGVWRTFYLDPGDRITHDLLEVGPSPYLARLPLGGKTADQEMTLPDEVPPGVMNAMSLLTEMRDHAARYRPGDLAHVINLTLLPLSPADTGFLDAVLGTGPVEILSRGYGNCHVGSTRFENVWRVRFYNSMNKLILDSIEIIDLPLVACAAAEDIADSAQRLREILESYWSRDA
jgi:hydrogenase-1 operon protein HyaF